ncbi:galactokinase [Hyphobacterium sp.]|uniref:galactokinase n=1 Tax=Hyphobacterium sp. TaxID=2004662 RepID=UPI003BABBEDC
MVSQSWTPGRVNLIGEWIDFNGGTVLPAALPLGVQIRLSQGEAGLDCVQSAQFEGSQTSPIDAAQTGSWADYVFGALQTARRQGWIEGGQSVSLDSQIPAGAGVSSSAAVTVGVLKAAAPESTDLTQIATLARQVENEFMGVPCGIMDQMAVAHSGAGEAIALDTRMLVFEPLPLPDGWIFAVIHSGVERQLADGRYKARRDACLEAARLLELDWLCDAGDLSGLPSRLHPIGRHVVNENRRVISAIEAMKAGDVEHFGAAMNESHTSLRDDFAVSTPEIDALVDAAVELGALGARLTGAGFGGCIVALLQKNDAAGWRESLSAKHAASRWICDVEGG